LSDQEQDLYATNAYYLEEIANAQSVVDTILANQSITTTLAEKNALKNSLRQAEMGVGEVRQAHSAWLETLAPEIRDALEPPQW